MAELDTPRWVHVGRFDVYSDESGRLVTKPAPTQEFVRAGELAPVIRDLRREPQRAVAALEESVKGVKAATSSLEKLVGFVRDLANLTDPAIAAKRAEEIIARILEDYREGRFREAVILIGAVLNIYLLAERWRALVGLLQLDRLAAEKLGDSAEVSAAQHDLDCLADAAGLTPSVGESPDEAHAADEPAGDLVADATGQATRLAPQAAVHTGAALGAKVAAAAAGALVLAGAATGFVVGGGVWFGLGPGDEKVREGGDAEVTGFAVRSDSSEAGTIDERTGWSAPENSGDSGDELDACEPISLYAFIAFEGMAAETEWSVEARNEGEVWSSDRGTWSFESSYTERFRAHRGGRVIPYGSWTFVTTIAGEEVDEAEIALVNAC